MKKVAVLLVVSASLAGCGTYGHMGTSGLHPSGVDQRVVHGAVVGGIAGGLIGGIATANVGGALVGAGLGAAAGAAIATHLPSAYPAY